MHFGPIFKVWRRVLDSKYLVWLDFIRNFVWSIFILIFIFVNIVSDEDRVTRGKWNLNVYNFSTFWTFLSNFGYIKLITLKCFLKHQNENIQIFQINQFWKKKHTKWILFKTWFWPLRIAWRCIRFVKHHIVKNEKPG